RTIAFHSSVCWAIRGMAIAIWIKNAARNFIDGIITQNRIGQYGVLCPTNAIRSPPLALLLRNSLETAVSYELRAFSFGTVALTMFQGSFSTVSSYQFRVSSMR